MNDSGKLGIIRSLNESEFRREVLIPLFRAMGFKDVIEYHGGASEKGKDIVYYTIDAFGDRTYTAVVVKKGNISGSVSDKGSAMTILNQAQQALQQPYTDIYGLKEVTVDYCLVVTSGKILNTAMDSIIGTLKGSNLNKVMKFFDGGKLISLLDQHMPEYFWTDYEHFNKYSLSLTRDFEDIRDISALGIKGHIKLDQIFVSLKVIDKGKDYESLTEDEGKLVREYEAIGRRVTHNRLSPSEQRTIDRYKKMKKKKERQDSQSGRILAADEIVDSFSRVVIVGNPGSGKTTLLKHFTLKLAKENLIRKKTCSIPIPITLNEFSQSGKELRQFIDVVFERYDFPQAKDFIEKELMRGNCILFLDGFDELASRERQTRSCRGIEDFLLKYPRNKLVITSRIAGYHDELKDFLKLELLDFNDDQIERFIENWFGNTEKATYVHKAIEENERIRAMARNPLLMSIIAVIFEEDKQLPQRRADLYRRCVEVLLSRWDVYRGVRNEYPSDKKEFILKKIAMHFHINRKRTCRKKELLSVILGYFPRIDLEDCHAEDFLQEICTRNVIIRQQSIDTYDFLHLSFQEYLAALDLVERNDYETLIEHIRDPWWEEVILLFVGIKMDATEFVEIIESRIDEDSVHTNLLLFGKCVADAEFTESATKKAIIGRLWELFEYRGFSAARSEGIRILATIRSPEVKSLLTEAVKNDRYLPRFRRDAAIALTTMGDRDAMEAFLKTLRLEEDYLKVKFAVDQILEISGKKKEAIGVIRSVLGHENERVRIYAIEKLEEIGGKESTSILSHISKTDESANVRLHAVKALSTIGGGGVLRTLTWALKNDEDARVRLTCIGELSFSFLPNALEAVTQALMNDNDAIVRFRAADALKLVSEEDVPKVLPFLVKSLKSDREWFVRRTVAETLGRIGGDVAVDALKHILDLRYEPGIDSERDGIAGVKIASVNAIGRIGGETAVEILNSVLQNEKDLRVKDRASNLLGQLGRNR